jgi:glycosyltransferase involved in cell wall biosynthesis
MYGISINKLEFFPLGGSIVSDSEYAETRSRIRRSHSLQSNHLVFIQSGKIDYSKKLLESLAAFSALDNPNLVFFVVGYLHPEVKDQVFAFMHRDSRIQFLGWKTPGQLRELLCAADIYVQPGTQSASMQMSLCCRCIAILDDVPSHKLFINDNDNGWLVGKELSLNEAFRLASQNYHRLDHMSRNSFEVATRMLDYKVLAARIYT